MQEVLETDSLRLINLNSTPVPLFDLISECDISYSEFFTKYLYTNTPCLVKNVSKDWKCQKEWVSSNKPNINHLCEKYGESEAPVSNCSERYYNAHTSEKMKVEEFMNYWEKYISNAYPSHMPCLYLKDWHFCKKFPEENVYRVPKVFASDWLNEYFLEREELDDDYKFIYMGPKGSWTPLHADVFSSFSWSVNICGRKKWVFFPPGEEKFLRDKLGYLAYDLKSDELKDIVKYPHFKGLSEPIYLIQEAGDAVFVPSNWYHQVWNLEDTISVNHNWVNGCNIKYMWNSIQDHFREVQKEIDDCHDMENWDEHCQLILKTSYGLNYAGFCNFLVFIALRRLDSLDGGRFLVEPGDWSLGRKHMIFDLLSLKPIFEEIQSLPLVCFEPYRGELKEILNRIEYYTDLEN